MEKRKGLIVVISGPAGSGKGTVVDMLIEKEPEKLALSISATTRKPRLNEVEGKSYYFITREEFEKSIEEKKMLEYNYYVDNYYGTPADKANEIIESGKSLILEIDVNGGLNVKKSYPEAVLIMLLPPNIEVQKQRLLGRGSETPETLERRLLRAHEEIKCIPLYDYVVYNYDNGTAEARDDILAIIRAELCSRGRNIDAADRFLLKQGSDVNN